LLKDGNVVVKVMVLTFHADLCRIAEIERGDQKGRWEWLSLKEGMKGEN
jgi:hypothetical protein